MRGKIPMELAEKIAALVNVERWSLAIVVSWLEREHGVTVTRMAISKLAASHRTKPLGAPRVTR